MIKIDADLLEELGLGELPQGERRLFLSHIYETLEMRVGVTLADQMTSEQLDEFEALFSAKDDAGALRWLTENFPNYPEIVNAEFDVLKEEIKAQAQDILAAVQSS